MKKAGKKDIKELSKEWKESMNLIKLPETLISFIRQNRDALLGVAYPDLLGVEIVGAFKRMNLHLKVNTDPEKTNEAVLEALTVLQRRLENISVSYNLKLDGIEQLLGEFNSPLCKLVTKARPKKQWYSWSAPIGMPVLLGKWWKLLLFPQSIEAKLFVPIMIRISAPLSLLLETGKMLGLEDFELFMMAFDEKFKHLVSKAKKLIKEQEKFAHEYKAPLARTITKSFSFISPSKRDYSKTNSQKKRTLLLKEHHDNSSSVSLSGKRPSRPYVRSIETIEKMKRQINSLWKKSNKDQVYGSGGSNCKARDIKQLVNHLNSSVNVMNSYMSLLVAGREDFKRLSPIMYKYIIQGKTELITKALKAIKLSERVKRNPPTSTTILLPISIDDFWLLSIITINIKGNSSVEVLTPVLGIEKKVLLRIGSNLITPISRHLEDAGCIFVKWSRVKVTPILGSSLHYERSYGLVLGMARAILLDQDYTGVQGYEESIYQAAIDLLDGSSLNKI